MCGREPGTSNSVRVHVCVCMCACACVHVHVCMCVCVCAMPRGLPACVLMASVEVRVCVPDYHLCTVGCVPPISCGQSVEGRTHPPSAPREAPGRWHEALRLSQGAVSRLPERAAQMCLCLYVWRLMKRYRNYSRTVEIL